MTPVSRQLGRRRGRAGMSEQETPQRRPGQCSEMTKVAWWKRRPRSEHTYAPCPYAARIGDTMCGRHRRGRPLMVSGEAGISESIEMAADRIRELAREMQQTTDSGELLELSQELRRANVELRNRVRRQRTVVAAEQGRQG